MGLDCYLRATSDPYMQIIYGCDSRGVPGTRSSAWLVVLLHSCGGICLRTTRRKTCTVAGPWHLTVSSRWAQNISACATILFVCSILQWETYAQSVSSSHRAVSCGYDRDHWLQTFLVQQRDWWLFQIKLFRFVL